MLKVKVFTVGKNKESWIKSGINEYEKRLKSTMQFEWIFLKTMPKLEEMVLKEKFFICLDVVGKELDSIKFSQIVFDFFEKNNSKISFVIGDANGLTSSLKKNSFYNISLSKLTFTHQMTRLILIEQLYRAEQIVKNTQYQK